MDYENTIRLKSNKQKNNLRTKKIKFYPNQEQRKILKLWFDASRKIYNTAVEKFDEINKEFKKEQMETYLMKQEDFYTENQHMEIYESLRKNKNIKKRDKTKKIEIKKPLTFIPKYEYRDRLLKEIPEWTIQIPCEIKSEAICDFYKAKINAIEKYKKMSKTSKIKFRTYKDVQSIFIPRRSVKNNKFYPRLICKKKIGKDINPSEDYKNADGGCRVIKEKTGDYYICIPKKMKLINENERLGIVALDPGERTFQTFYNEYVCGEWGYADKERLYKICIRIDKINILISNTKGNRRRIKNLKKVKLKKFEKIRNLVRETHDKLAIFLCKNFDIVLIPTFETRNMCSKLNSKTARNIYTWSHYRFKQRLKNKGIEYKTLIIDVNESYTSKTCGICGYVNSSNSNKDFKCFLCKKSIDRDINGSRNILMKTILNSKIT